MAERIVLVTGASRGIGAATALRLGRKGHFVCVHFHRERASAEAVLDQIRAKGGAGVAFQGDMGCERDIVDLFAQIRGRFGPVTALVNNAAVNGACPSLEEVSFEGLSALYAVNVFGPLVAIREAVRHMRAKGGGSIVNITSESARFGGNRMVPYASSKAALANATLGLARELASFGIRVNAVSPGVIDTGVHDGAGEPRRQRLLESLPMGRMGRPEEVADAVAWLLSEEAAYTSGAVLSVAGAR